MFKRCSFHSGLQMYEILLSFSSFLSFFLLLLVAGIRLLIEGIANEIEGENEGPGPGQIPLMAAAETEI